MTPDQYLRVIEKQFSAGNATEHTHRPALKAFVESLLRGVTATNEPKRVKCGAPDFIVTKGEIPVGYIEAKDVGLSLDNAENSDQIERYRQSLGNLILTNYLEFRWYVRPTSERTNEYPEAEHRLTARLATVGKAGKFRVEESGPEHVVKLLNAFLRTQVPTVQSAKELAIRMAALASLIRDTIRNALSEEGERGSLHQQMQGFREVLIHDLSDDQFADMYGQTISYGLFAARCSQKDSQHFTREHAAYDLPKTNPFLRKMFNHIAGPELDERIAWAVDDLAELLHRANIGAILRDFGKRTRREDPVVHFYETFLAAYDPEMREARGVYYTPEPIVSYIVRSIDYLLKVDFQLTAGLADCSKVRLESSDRNMDVHKVLILDPATGTGTFLYGVINHIFESFKNNEGMWSGYVSEHLLPRLFGFELLMAPYAVAHMKLGLLLAETGYGFQTDERLGVYLTNTLEEAHKVSKMPLFTQWLAQEANAASKIKQEKPVMVVTGNPPYSVSSQNKGDWISALIEDYKKDLNEKKLNLDDDFIKFFRFAQWRINQTGYGILAFISNNVYLDGLTHRRMRQSLMNTFDEIYVLDLHGNSNKKERSPDGSKDENVFDIQQGVAIGIFVKKPESRGAATVRHAELWGLRETKYQVLLDTDVSNTAWRELTDVDRKSCLGSFHFFTPKAFDNIDEYCEGWSLRNIFGTLQNAIKTDRDDIFYDFDKTTLANRMKTFYSDEGLSSAFRDKYRVQDSSSYALLSRRLSTSFDRTNIRQSLYRPFDVRYLYYAPGLTSRPAWEVMQHMIAGANIGLITTRQTSDDWDCLVTNIICGHKSVAAYDINSLLPLYLYRNEDRSLFTDSVVNRKSNLKSDFVDEFRTRLGLIFMADGKGDRITSFGPEDVFDYLYAVFHSNNYRNRYKEFLRIDFARLPLTSNAELFRGLCTLGSKLVSLHLLNEYIPSITTYPIAGKSNVEVVRYAPQCDGHSNFGRVWINNAQYFEGIPTDVWNFNVGGYQVCDKWLKDRKDRQLTYEELTNYQKIVSALNETIALMSEIDKLIDKHGGWPIR